MGTGSDENKIVLLIRSAINVALYFWNDGTYPRTVRFDANRLLVPVNVCYANGALFGTRARSC